MRKLNTGTGNYDLHQTLTGDTFTGYSCISGDAEFLAIGGDNKYRISKLNSGTGQYDEINDLTLTGAVRNCEFSNDKTFFFIGSKHTFIYKYDGSLYQTHQTLTTVGNVTSPAIDFVHPYLLVPSKNAGGVVIVDFLEHNSNSDQW